MRRWLAVLVFVPGLAWGECYDVRIRSDYTDYVMLLKDLKADGVDERKVLDTMGDSGIPHMDAALYEAVRLVYRPSDISISSIVTAMQNACYRQARD